MAEGASWHSKKPRTKVYRNNSDCERGNNIEKENRKKGPGKGLILCHRYKELNEQQGKKKRKRK